MSLLAFMLLAACAGTSPAEVGTVQEAGPIGIPATYQGHWSNSLDNCDLDTGDWTEWLFVGPESAGSFEHSYPVTDVLSLEDRVEFTTKFGDRMVIYDLGSERVELHLPDGKVAPLVLCPEEVS